MTVSDVRIGDAVLIGGQYLRVSRVRSLPGERTRLEITLRTSGGKEETRYLARSAEVHVWRAPEEKSPCPAFRTPRKRDRGLALRGRS
jgi:hypothetical protein